MTAGSRGPRGCSPWRDAALPAAIVLHLEMAAAISQAAAPHHPRWAWALSQRMDTLLIHLFGRPALLPGNTTAELETVDWHPQAQVDFFGVDLGDVVIDDPLATTIQIAGSLRRFGGADVT